jgi:hypothetical protein
VYNSLIVTRLIDNNQDPDNLQAYTEAKEAVREEMIAKHFLFKSDPKRFGPLIASI